jgi:hypothetical protein
MPDSNINLDSIKFAQGRAYKLDVVGADTYNVGTIIATYSDTVESGLEYHFTDAYYGGFRDKTFFNEFIAPDGRIFLKNDDKHVIAYNPDTLKSIRLKNAPFLMTQKQQEAEEHTFNYGEHMRRYQTEQKRAALLQDPIDKEFYDQKSKPNATAQDRTLNENRTKSYKKQRYANKTRIGNLFKEARRAKRNAVEHLSFEEGKVYSIPVNDDVIIAIFQHEAENQFFFNEAKGYYEKFITEDGRVSIQKVAEEYRVVNPDSRKSAVLQYAPTLLNLTQERMDESLSDLSDTEIVFKTKKPRMGPSTTRRPRKLPRKKSLKKIKPNATSVPAFMKRNRKTGKKVVDYSYTAAAIGEDLLMGAATLYGYPYLMKKYKSRCVIPGHLEFKHNGSNGVLTYIVRDKIKKAKAIGDDLVECIDSRVPAVFIPLTILEGRSMGHANMLIYRPFLNIVERFEPAHQRKESNSSLNADLNWLFQSTLKSRLGAHTPEFHYPQAEMNDALTKLKLPHPRGLQFLEQDAPGKKKEESEGYCQMWSLFIMECILIAPEKPTKDIIQECYDISNGDPQYLRDLIRGYVENMNNEIQKSMGMKVSIKRNHLGSDKKFQKILQNAYDYAALLKKRHKRTEKREGSPSSHSSDYNDSSGFSSASPAISSASPAMNLATPAMKPLVPGGIMNLATPAIKPLVPGGIMSSATPAIKPLVPGGIMSSATPAIKPFEARRLEMAAIRARNAAAGIKSPYYPGVLVQFTEQTLLGTTEDVFKVTGSDSTFFHATNVKTGKLIHLPLEYPHIKVVTPS